MRNVQSHKSSNLGHRSAALVLAVAATACSTGRSALIEPLPPNTVVAFENATIDPVSVYVDERGSQWLLGHVEPGRKARLRLPDSVKFAEVTLVVVPLGTRRDGARSSEVIGAIRSELLPTEYLVTMRWLLRGRQLVGATLPARRR